MTPRQRESLQSAVLDAIHRAHPGSTDREIAGVAGVDRSLVSRWRSGEREIGLSELLSLQRHYGSEAALSPLAALDGCRVVSASPPAVRRDLRDLALEIGSCAGEALSQVRAALTDGRIDADEGELLQGTAASLRALADELERGAKEGR